MGGGYLIGALWGALFSVGFLTGVSLMIPVPPKPADTAARLAEPGVAAPVAPVEEIAAPEATIAIAAAPELAVDVSAAPATAGPPVTGSEAAPPKAPAGEVAVAESPTPQAPAQPIAEAGPEAEPPPPPPPVAVAVVVLPDLPRPSVSIEIALARHVFPMADKAPAATGHSAAPGAGVGVAVAELSVPVSDNLPRSADPMPPKALMLAMRGQAPQVVDTLTLAAMAPATTSLADAGRLVLAVARPVAAASPALLALAGPSGGAPFADVTTPPEPPLPVDAAVAEAPAVPEAAAVPAMIEEAPAVLEAAEVPAMIAEAPVGTLLVGSDAGTEAGMMATAEPRGGITLVRPPEATGDATVPLLAQADEAVDPALPGRPVRRLPGIAADPAGAVAAAEGAADADGPPLLRYAAAFDNPADLPLLGIVLIAGPGDVAVPAFPASIALDPGAEGSSATADVLRDGGAEVVMLATGLPLGANASDVEVTFQAHLAALPQAVAVMDLPELAFQNDRQLARQVVAILAAEGLGLITYKKGSDAAGTIAEGQGLAHAQVWRVLDGSGENAAAIGRELDRAAFEAGRSGQVLVVGQANEATISAIAAWAAQKADRVALAPFTALLAD